MREELEKLFVELWNAGFTNDANRRFKTEAQILSLIRETCKSAKPKKFPGVTVSGQFRNQGIDEYEQSLEQLLK